MADVTCLYYTANTEPEAFAAPVRDRLRTGERGACYANEYRQILIGPFGMTAGATIRSDLDRLAWLGRQRATIKIRSPWLGGARWPSPCSALRVHPD